jgi:integrase
MTMLTALNVTKATPADRPYKLTDERGLYLLVTPKSKLWRYKYRHGGKEKLLALGDAKEVTLADARIARDDARKLLKSGVDPSADRKRTKLVAQFAAANSFEEVAREWYKNQLKTWSARHAGYIIRRLEGDVFPDIGRVPIADLDAVQLLACLRKIEARGAYEMARRNLQYVSNICRYAIATGRAKRDVAADLRGALEAQPRERHLAALTLKQLPEFFKRLKKYDGLPLTPLAVKLLMLSAVRTNELIGARWDDEFSLGGKTPEWRIPGERMKMGEPHIVPLTKQHLAVLQQIRQISGAGELVFPSATNPRASMSNNTILYALYRMGYHSRATGHGMRTLFSTTMNEAGYHADVIERQLAHLPGDAVRAAYNRAQWMPERRKLMQAWADRLTKAGL